MSQETLDNETTGQETVEENIHDRPIRLNILENANGHNLSQKIQLRLMKLVAGRIPGPHLVLSYKRDLFGKYFAAFTQRSMRQSKYWKKEELELFASFTANQLNCSY